MSIMATQQQRQGTSGVGAFVAFVLVVLVAATAMRMFDGDAGPEKVPATEISHYLPSQAECNDNPTLMGC